MERELASGLTYFLALLLFVAGTAKLVAPATFRNSLDTVIPRIQRSGISSNLVARAIAIYEIALAVGLVFASHEGATIAAILCLGTSFAFVAFVIGAKRKRTACGCFGSLSLAEANGTELTRAGIFAVASLTLFVINFVEPRNSFEFRIGSLFSFVAAFLLFFMFLVRRFEGSRHPRHSEIPTVHSRRSFLRLGGTLIGSLPLGLVLGTQAFATTFRGEQSFRRGPLRSLSPEETAKLKFQALNDVATNRLFGSLGELGLYPSWDEVTGSHLELIGDSVRWRGDLLHIPVASAGGADVDAFWSPDVTASNGSMATALFYREGKWITSDVNELVTHDGGSFGQQLTAIAEATETTALTTESLCPPNCEIPPPPCNLDACNACRNDCRACEENAASNCRTYAAGAAFCCGGSLFNPFACLFCAGAAVAACGAEKLACSDNCDCSQECTNC